MAADSIAPAPFHRDHPDPLADTLPPLALDRQRIIHSAAFRRLQYKTQVFLALEGDHYRTRLTHTLEVANLARLIAARLNLSADLAETVALAHDLGHPPFGHAGERALNSCLAAQGGFEHNVHALRVVEFLEHPYPSFRGLNLTRVVRECLAKHSTVFDRPARHPLQDGRPAPLEGQIADLADRLAYGLHDLQDGLHAGLLNRAELNSIDLWVESYGGPPADSQAEWRGHIRPAIDRMQSRLVNDALAHSRSAAHRADPAGPPRQHDPPPRQVRLSDALDAQLRALEELLLTRLYRHPKLRRRDAKARRILSAVFESYAADPGLMPPRFAARVAEQGPARVAADYIAGMTDRFALREHARLFDPRLDE